ncbi:MAG: type II secretion system protein GspM [Candidatus Contendobacter sp.]
MGAAPAPGRGHRLAALLLLLLASGALYLVVDQGLVGRYRYYQNSLEQHQGRLAQLDRMAATLEPVRQLIAKIQQDRGVTAQYLPQSVPALAAAELQQRLKAMVEAVGGTLQSIQALPPVEEAGAVKVTISAVMNGDAGGLQKVLFNLESQTPLLFVDNLEVTARATRPRLPNGRYASYTRTQLNVQFEVSGYLRKEGG